LRRELRPAERFSEAAICFGSRNLKTPRRRSSASLSQVTRCDQRFGAVLRPRAFDARFFRPFRLLAARETASFRFSAIAYSALF
jgi:hypothetical protein